MIQLLNRHWLLTSTTYGTWLPGDRRGFVSPVHDEHGELVLHNIPETPYDADLPLLERHARQRLRGLPVLFTRDQGDTLLCQFLETAHFREWCIVAASIMPNHVHIVVTVAGDPEPKTLLQSLKSYGSRALNRKWSKPASGTWWTESGSKRKLPHEHAVRAGTRYVYHQHGFLARYVDPEVPADWYTPVETLSGD